MTTKIISNGSTWAGEDPHSLELLEDRLRNHTLSPRFEEYGNFTELLNEGHPQDGMTTFFGNFWDLSAVFNIFTDDQDVIDRLTPLIRANQETAAYARAKRDIEADDKKRREESERRDRGHREQRILELRRLEESLAGGKS